MVRGLRGQVVTKNRAVTVGRPREMKTPVITSRRRAFWAMGVTSAKGTSIRSVHVCCVRGRTERSRKLERKEGKESGEKRGPWCWWDGDLGELQAEA